MRKSSFGQRPPRGKPHRGGSGVAGPGGRDGGDRERDKDRDRKGGERTGGGSAFRDGVRVRKPGGFGGKKPFGQKTFGKPFGQLRDDRADGRGDDKRGGEDRRGDDRRADDKRGAGRNFRERPRDDRPNRTGPTYGKRPGRDDGERRDFKGGVRGKDGFRSKDFPRRNDGPPGGDRARGKDGPRFGERERSGYDKTRGGERDRGGDRPRSGNDRPGSGSDRGRFSDRGRDRTGDRDRGPRRDGAPGKGSAFKVRKRPGGKHGARPDQQTVAAVSEPMRIAKAMARAGLCSRREAERWIAEGRVSLNGRVMRTPAVEVKPRDRVLVDGVPMPVAEPAQLWRYNKAKGLVTTHNDPQGRPTVFDNLPPGLPRVISVGRLDFNTEGLILLTNDGELARHLELPATGWLRRYRVRCKGRVTEVDLEKLKEGVEIEGVRYGPIEAAIDTVQGANMWLTIGIREGKNREVRNVLASLGLDVNRLIRISFGPFQLLTLKPGEAEVVRRRVLADQLGPELADEFGLIDKETKKPGGKPHQQAGKPQQQSAPKNQKRDGEDA